ncbi:MAG: AarF/ABC1/UbiB kinase family protein [Cyanobacteria bacterium]|nr:AarF/ABC1/UbiB kinase family protein [Cyanobacteriota bacterium]
MLDLARNASREAEILEVLLSNGWDYMRQLLSGSSPEEPELPPPAVLRNILTDLGPVYIKLGQLLSTRPDLLPEAYLEALSSLQAAVPAVPAGEIEALVRRELPIAPEQAFASINYEAIAAGSIGQTHRATLIDGRSVAVKVQRPGIGTAVARDIALIENIAQLVATTQFGRRFDTVALAAEFARALEAELDFTREAHHTEKLRHNLNRARWFRGDRLAIPAIHWPLTTDKILVMDWLDGGAILDRADLRGSDRGREAVTLLVRAFMQQYLIDGFFHADPHPGNLFYLADGRVGILDCGMVGTLDPRTRGVLTELLLAILSGDPKRCAKISLELTEPVGPVDLMRLEKDYGQLLRRYYNLTLSEVNTSEAFQQILQAGVRNNLRWPGSIGLFAKSLTNLEGTARQLHPELDLEQELQPLMGDLFRLQILGDAPLESMLQTALEFKNLSLTSPRQLGFLLDRLSSETLRLTITIPEVEKLRRNISESANRRTFGTVLSALIIGTAILGSGQQTAQVQLFSNVLFGAAAVLGLWLLVSMLRSGQWR